MVSATTASAAEAVSALLTQLTFGYKVSPKAKEKEARENCANPRKEEARTCRHGIDGVLAGGDVPNMNIDYTPFGMTSES